MTIKAYMDTARETAACMTPQGHSKNYADLMAETTEIWSNYACMGYCVEAARRMGLAPDTINKFVNYLHRAFDDFTVTEAEQIFNDS